jgi:hypothetical protein
MRKGGGEAKEGEGRCRWAMRFCLSAVVCGALALLSAGCTAPVRVDVADDPIVYVIGRGWHTDIGLPAEEISGDLARLKQGLPGVRFLTFGFGDRQYLVKRATNFGDMLAALLPSESALLMTALRASPRDAFGAGNVVELHVSRMGLARIQAGLWHEFEVSGSGDPVMLAEGPYPGSAFYAARDTYDGFYTCNTWTARLLHSGGLPMPVTGVLFSEQVMGMARWIAAPR